jgi:hypothetical protein
MKHRYKTSESRVEMFQLCSHLLKIPIYINCRDLILHIYCHAINRHCRTNNIHIFIYKESNNKFTLSV